MPVAASRSAVSPADIAMPTVGRAAARGRSLLDLDPDLGRALPGERRRGADADLRVRVHSRTRGLWPMRAAAAAGPLPGVLIIDGVIASDILLDDVVSTELLGAGDILRPWPLEG